MEHLIEVSHMNGVWCLSAHGCFEPTLFRSGGRAEEAARHLAGRLATHGCEARVCIRDSRNLVVGEHRYFACQVVAQASRATAAAGNA
jgi:hypothetical protein